ncbi:hypothetical protein PTSG_05984 [Salpingoeca rosetta]|uniref:Uncharacterized protein n=1 Tax=Salpingoeca rosetta (strain ATCC 50818 / BSB-021) TaxID=946362 RepID=F2UDC4_SALR5|nr:uncharacterized protein PTSG_05984 [Salpingoeca rosetta]EGD74619.1 hypothetical protein PTSG_05984 [Salpingoeca rosetta]|eukprot:XP_004992876.1 hypothetical protein PTSG_05984 [Salpingoeca rosetta]
MNEDEAQRILELLESKDERIRTLEQSLLRLQSSQHHAQAEYHELQRVHRLEVDQLQLQLNQTSQELASLRELRDSTENLSNVCTVLRSENESLKQAVDELANNATELQDKLEAANRRADHHLQTSESQTAHIESLKLAVCNRDEEIERLRDHITDLQRERANWQLEKRHTHAQTQLSVRELQERLRIEEESHEDTCRQLNSSNEMLAKVKRNVQETVQQFEDQLLVLRQKHQDEVEHLKSQLANRPVRPPLTDTSTQTDSMSDDRLSRLENQVRAALHRPPSGASGDDDDHDGFGDSDASGDANDRTPLPSSCARFKYLSRLMDFDSAQQRAAAHLRYPDDKYLHELQGHILAMNKEHGAFVDHQLQVLEEVQLRYEAVPAKLAGTYARAHDAHAPRLRSSRSRAGKFKMGMNGDGGDGDDDGRDDDSGDGGETKMHHRRGTTHSSSRYSERRANPLFAVSRMLAASPPSATTTTATAAAGGMGARVFGGIEHVLRSIEQNIERVSQSAREREDESKQIVRIVQDKIKTTMWRLQEDIMSDVTDALQQVSAVQTRKPTPHAPESNYTSWLERRLVEALAANTKLRTENTMMAKTPNVAVTSYRHCASMLVDSFSSQASAMVAVIVDALSLMHSWLRSRRNVELAQHLCSLRVSKLDELAQELTMLHARHPHHSLHQQKGGQTHVHERVDPSSPQTNTTDTTTTTATTMSPPSSASHISGNNNNNNHKNNSNNNNTGDSAHHHHRHHHRHHDGYTNAFANDDSNCSVEDDELPCVAAVEGLASEVADIFSAQGDVISKTLVSELSIQTRTQQLYVSLSSTAAALQGTLSALQESLCLTSQPTPTAAAATTTTTTTTTTTASGATATGKHEESVDVVQQFARVCTELQSATSVAVGTSTGGVGSGVDVLSETEPRLKRQPRSRGTQTADAVVDVRKHRRELRSVKTLNQELASRVELLEERKDQLEAELKSAQQKLVHHRKEIDIKRHCIEDLRGRLSATKDDHATCAERYELLQRKHASAKAELRRLSQRTKQLQDEREKLHAAESEHRAAEEKMAKMADLSKSTRREVKREKERSSRLAAEVEELQEQLRWAQQEYVEYQQRAALNAKQLQDEIQHLRAAYEDMSHELDEKRSSFGHKHSQGTQTADSGVDSSGSETAFSQDRVMRNVQSLLNLTDSELFNILNA